MTNRFAAFTLAAGLLALPCAAVGQDPPARQRTLFTLKHAEAGTLADAIKGHFKNEAVITPLSLGSGNGLLVSGAPAAVTEIAKLVAELDKAPKSIAVEVILAEIVPKGADGRELTAADFTGPTTDVLVKLLAVPAANRVTPVQRLKVSAVEGQPIAVTSGGDRPFTTGVERGAPKGGFQQRSVVYRSMGTTVRVTCRAAADDSIIVDLDLKDTRAKSGEAGDEAQPIDTATLATKLSLKANRAVAAQALRTDGKSGTTLSLVIVTAHLTDPAK